MIPLFSLENLYIYFLLLLIGFVFIGLPLSCSNKISVKKNIIIVIISAVIFNIILNIYNNDIYNEKLEFCNENKDSGYIMVDSECFIPLKNGEYIMSDIETYTEEDLKEMRE